MLRNCFSLITILVFTLLLAAGTVAADEKKKERNLPSTGVLSGSYLGGNEGVVVPGQWGKEDVDIFTETSSPITGSVSRVNARDWVMRVFNKSEDTYSFTVRVIQKDKNNRSVKSDTYSYRLEGGGSEEMNFTARTNTEQAELQLVQWKNLTPKDDEEEEQASEEDGAEEE